MALIITVDDPKRFINLWNLEIQNYLIKTWLRDSDGDYTLSNPDWRSKAWFKAYFEGKDRIVFGIVPSTIFPMTNELYGVYHGRLASTLIANYDTEIRHLEITSGYHKLDIVLG